MTRTVRRTIALLLTIILFIGCNVTAPNAGNNEPVEQNTGTPAEVVVNESPIAADAEDIVISETATPKTHDPASEGPAETPAGASDPTETAAPGQTPEPTATPEPNPYVGVWTIEDMPFSLELRDDYTYLVTASENEREGVYSFDANTVTLSVQDGSQVELRYYMRADALKAGDFKLIRDDLVFFFDIGGIPITYQAENEDLSVKVRGAVVSAEARNGKRIQSFCFTGAGLIPPDDSRDWFDASDSGKPVDAIRVFKYDGSYTLWTRGADGVMLPPIDVTVASGYHYPPQQGGDAYLHQALRVFLKDRGTSVDELNRCISRDVIAAGIYSRAGVASAAVSLVSTLSQYGYAVGYQENGTYQTAQEWGVNPNWGKKLGVSAEETDEVESVDSYTGMNSISSIEWTYKQAGMNLCTDAATPTETIGERERAHDNRINADRAEQGDLIKQNKHHYMIVIDRLDLDGDGRDDTYLVLNVNATVMTIEELPFSQAESCEAYSMDAFFDGTGKNYFKVLYWRDQFRIPAEDLPLYMKETMESEKTQQSFMDLLQRLGF